MIQIQENIPMAPLTSFRLGGNARYYVEVKTLDELKEALQFAKEKNTDFYVLGGGSNVVVCDSGFLGVVIRMKINETCANDNVLEIGAGVPLIKAINVAAAEELSGMESLAGIPGTVGGAVRGNAGAFGSEIGPLVKSVKVLDVEKMSEVIFNRADCEFGYRTSAFKNNKNLIIISVQFELSFGESEAIKQKIQQTIAMRTSKGLHGVMSAGSFFMNPVVENKQLLDEFEKENGAPSKNGKIPAGWIIEQAGLKGKKIGGAQMSEIHANYLINTGDATADDVMMLQSYVKQQIRDQFGIQMQEEVNYVGF